MPLWWVTHANESVRQDEPDEILPAAGEHHAFLPSYDHCPAGDDGRDDSERGQRMAER